MVYYFLFQDFTVTILLHLNWVDGRFKPFMPESKEGYVEIDSKNLEKLWVPDLFFPNEKNAYYHDVLMPNKMLRVYDGGTLSYTTRYRALQVSYILNYKTMYPFLIAVFLVARRKIKIPCIQIN